MSAAGVFRIEIDGLPPEVADLQRLALDHDGHFTAMQVRDARVRGLDNHLARLDEGSLELFGVGLEGRRIRDLARHALADDVRDASLRVIVFEAAQPGSLSVMVTSGRRARCPRGPWPCMPSSTSAPWRTSSTSMGSARPTGRGWRGTRASTTCCWRRRRQIAETSIANIGIVRGGEVVWPDAPALRGITMQLVEPRLPAAGVASHREPVRLADLSSFDAAFVTNSRGIAPVGRIDEVAYAVDEDMMAALAGVYAAVPWDAF